jgi:DNA-binding GntR family transcriptional regulator
MVKALKCRDEAAAVAALEADVDLSFDLALTGLTEPLDPAALARPHAS